MAPTMGASLTDRGKRHSVLAATLALVASMILLVGTFFLVFLAVSDVEEYKSFVGDPGVAPPSWVTLSSRLEPRVRRGPF